MKWRIYIGSFALSFFSLDFDSETLEIENLRQFANPGGKSAFLAVSPDCRFLYTASEYMDGEGGIAAFNIEGGRCPVFLNSIPSGTQGPAQIALMRAYGKDYVLGGGFFDGDVIVCPIAEDGSLLPMSDHFLLAEGAHAHGIRPVPNSNLVVVPDTRNFKVYTFEMTPEGKLEKRFCYSSPDVQHPRHMTFSKDGKWLYLLTERANSLEVFEINRETGELIHAGHYNNLPDDYTVNGDASAAIHRSPDGKFIYLSNRGHDSIVTYRVDGANVTKTGYAREPISGPREFVITPDGNHMLVGNLDKATVSIFRINRETGVPEYTGKTFAIAEGPASLISVPQNDE